MAVRYSVGGTAKPGQTYEPLSGVVVIPAGQTSIAVPVYPLWDRVVDFDQPFSALHGKKFLAARNSERRYMNVSPMQHGKFCHAA